MKAILHSEHKADNLRSVMFLMHPAYEGHLVIIASETVDTPGIIGQMIGEKESTDTALYSIIGDKRDTLLKTFAGHTIEQTLSALGYEVQKGV